MFENKIVLVTGGTKGIGKSIVLKYLKNRATVITIYSSDTLAVKKLKKDLSSEELNHLFIYKGSISDDLFLKNLFLDIILKFKKIDILVNNAGINKDNLFLEMEDSDWNSVITTNIKGTLNISLLAIEHMKKNSEKSFIINLSSISGLFGRAAQANYACSKGGIIGVTKLLAKKYSDQNIQINTVVPGLINTEMAENMPKDKIQEVTNSTILKRMGEPYEVANVITFLTSNQASYISGACINIDGGFLK